MANHQCDALIITCIDFRFQEFISKWLAENFEARTYDRGAFSGAAKNIDSILSQIEISKRLHHIKKVVLINHQDCGAYGALGHVDHHIRDLHKASKTIKNKFPDLEVKTYYLHLDGIFKLIS